MATNIRAVIWDLDGVVLDSEREHQRAWERLAQDEGVTFTREDFQATFGKRNNDIIPLYWKIMSDQHLKELAERKELYFREIISETAAFLPGAEALMRGLHEAGFAQALGSSAPIENIKVISALLGLERYLAVLVSGETVPFGKPAPDIFLRAARELHVASAECVVIEDAVAGIEAARRAHMHCIAVAGERDLAGLRLADLMVKDLTEVTVDGVSALAR